MRVLLVNDDGVHATGIQVLKDVLGEIADVFVVAPLEERSASGHTITLHDPLRLVQISENVYGCNGFPADCVILGLNHVLKGKEVDFVISGINRGANLAQDIYYSGTVAGAREGAICGIPSIAVSLAMNYSDFFSNDPNYKPHFETAARFVAKLMEKKINHLIEPHHICNINVPNLPSSEISGIKTTFPGIIDYPKDVERRLDVRNRDYFWVGGTKGIYREIPGSDCQSIIDKCVSVSNLKLSMHAPDTDSKWACFFKEDFDY
ncbi:MAG: 5'/3'-nucleotidase SurE [Bacteriovoracaceae bacterium]|nr:5'/3'-nucleotidase SurE [Bacteriovoracaceae bacterium]